MDGQEDETMQQENGVPEGQAQPQQFLPAGFQRQYVPRPLLQVPVSAPDPVMMQLVTVMQQQQQQLAQQIQEQQQQMRQQQQNMAKQQESITAIVKQQQEFMKSMAATAGQIPFHPERIIDSLASNIKEFRYEAESSVTFAVWFSRYDDLFQEDAARLDDDAKVRLLLRKLGIEEHERYASFILPNVAKDFTFAETVSKLKGLFGSKESVVSKRYRCLQVAKQPTEDHVKYACRVNKLCVEFELTKLSEDEFKSLIYVCGLKSESDAELRTRLLSKIEDQPGVTLQQLSDECQRLLNLKHDNAMIEAPATEVNKIQQQRFDRHREKKAERSPSPPAPSSSKRRAKKPCWLCGGMHFREDCDYLDYRCTECDRIGHREGYCSCAKWSQQWKGRRTGSESNQVVTSNVVTVENARKGRKFVPVELDGVPVRLQLDTASDVTVISKKLWRSIGRPKLSAPSVDLKTATGTGLSLAGEFCCDVTVAGMTKFEKIRVTEKPIELLGLDLVDSFGLGSVPADTYCCNALRSNKVEQKLKERRPSALRVTPPAQDKCERGSFTRNDLVYARVLVGKFWRWVPGVIVESFGNNLFNVWVDNRRLERSHGNQLRTRLMA